MFNLCDRYCIRKQLSNKLYDQSHSMINPILSIMVFKQYSDWDETIYYILLDIMSDRHFMKRHRIMTKKFMFKKLYTEPYEDSDDEWIDFIVNDLTIRKSLKPRYRPSSEEIITVMKQLIDLVLDGSNTREKIKQIFKKYV